MKRIISVLLISAMLICFTACSNNTVEKSLSNKDKDNSISVVTTIFPEYDWVREITKDSNEDIELTLLLDNGTDLHSYQPTAEDILKISTCDVFIYVGGESDGWVDDALSEATNPDMKVINLLDVLGSSVKEEEVIEGMEPEEDDEENEDEVDEVEYDEHVWLSLKNAQILVDTIADTLGQVDSVNADAYNSNAADYIEKLSALDNQYEEAVANASFDTVIFGDRFPFRYLVDDYGLNYYAAFVGCSAETEASFETIVFLAEKMDELGINTILTIEGDNHGIAETIIDNTASKNQLVAVMDSLQSTSLEDAENGTTYLSVMTDNLESLKKAIQ